MSGLKDRVIIADNWLLDLTVHGVYHLDLADIMPMALDIPSLQRCNV